MICALLRERVKEGRVKTPDFKIYQQAFKPSTRDPTDFAELEVGYTLLVSPGQCVSNSKSSGTDEHPVYLHLTTFMPTQDPFFINKHHVLIWFPDRYFFCKKSISSSHSKVFCQSVMGFSIKTKQDLQVDSHRKIAKFIVLVLPFNSALQRGGNHELFFSFSSRHLSTELTVLCTVNLPSFKFSQDDSIFAEIFSQYATCPSSVHVWTSL